MLFKRYQMHYRYCALLSAILILPSCVSNDWEQETIGSDEYAIVTSCPFPQPSDWPIDFSKEMVITDVGVVDDHCRTTWDPACTADVRGKWTFGWMMAAMAGTTNVDSPVAKNFVAAWLTNWLMTQQPSPTSPAVLPREAIRDALIGPWLAASGCQPDDTLATCPLDLKLAPFRLLAFVNRVDMAGGSPYGTQSFGEFRVVFGVLGYDVINDVQNAALDATVILEYNFPNMGFSHNTYWMSQLHALSDPSLVDYNSSLQSITDAIVGPAAQSGNPNNGSVISQIRTNEINFDTNLWLENPNPDFNALQWEMRQFELPCSSSSCNLAQTTVSQTPDTTLNLHETMNQFVIDNQIPLLTASHVLPSHLLGNASHSPPGPEAVIWESPNPLNATTAPNLTASQRRHARHHFAISTCNGCHYIETSNQNNLFHISPRQPDMAASISNLLSAGGAADPIAQKAGDPSSPATEQIVTDPAFTLQKFRYNEPWRRACEIRRIMSNGLAEAYTTPTGHTN